MDNYNEMKEAVQPKVRFSISQEGEIKFDADGLEDWQLTDAIAQVASQAKQQRQATQKIREVTLTSELAMHGVALAFVLVLVSGATFTISRVISGAVQSGVQNVQR